MTSRIDQVKNLAKLLGVEPGTSQMDDFVWTLCTFIIVEMADEVAFGRAMAEMRRKQTGGNYEQK